jgi:uncharacterized membrane protein
MQKDYLIELGDAVVAERSYGRIKLNQLMNTTPPALRAHFGAVGLVFLNRCWA